MAVSDFCIRGRRHVVVVGFVFCECIHGYTDLPSPMDDHIDEHVCVERR